MEICLPPTTIKAKQWGEPRTETTSHIIHYQLCYILVSRVRLLRYSTMQQALWIGPGGARQKTWNVSRTRLWKVFRTALYRAREQQRFYVSEIRILQLYHCAETPFRGSHFKDPVAPKI